MRTVILHYHLFKNAGTSLDAAFKENFNDKAGEWVTKEFPAQPNKNREKVRQWIIDNPQAKCFSSHTAILPPPDFDDIKIIPVIFLRHPIDRIASAYYFEKNQGTTGFGPTLARNTSLSGYIETRLSIPADRQCRDFHAHRLAAMISTDHGDEATRARMAIKKLPFVGLVERYSESLAKLEALFEKEGIAGIQLSPFEINVSRRGKNALNDRLSEIEQKLGNNMFIRLLEFNSLDIELYSQMHEKDKLNLDKV